MACAWLRPLAIVVFSGHIVLLVGSVWTYSPTVDEVSHLPCGLSHWRFGRFDAYRVNPPLVQGLAAVPLLFCSHREDWSWYTVHKHVRSEFAIGKCFVDANERDCIRLYRFGRLACITFSVIGAVAVYWFARDLFGRTSGIVAMSLWCISPSVLGNGAIITPDVGGSAMAILAAMMFWRWLRDPDLNRCLLAGLTLGLAELAKTTCIILYLIWPCLWYIRYRQSRLAGDRSVWHECGQLLSILALGVYVTNLGYLFDGSFQRLGDFPFVSRTLGGPEAGHSALANRFRDTVLGAIPVPFPQDYVHGIDLQKLDFEGQRWSYAGGVQQLGGWWWWYLYALAVKTPHGTMVLVLMAVAASWVMPRDTAAVTDAPASRGCQPLDDPANSRVVGSGELDHAGENSSGDGIMGLMSPARLKGGLSNLCGDWLVLVPAVAILVLVSSQTGFSRYLRYLLPAYPFVFVWIGRVGQSSLMQRKWWAGAVIAALGWNVWSCLSIHPHHMAYFNELSGGPDHGHWHLLDANVDWGQASLELKRWLDEYRETEQAAERADVYLSLFAEQACMRPSDMGIEGQPLPLHVDASSGRNRPAPLDQLPPGLYAISVNHLHGYRHMGAGDPDCTEFLKLEPMAIIGHAIHVFRLPAEALSLPVNGELRPGRSDNL